MTAMRLRLFQGLRPFSRGGTGRDALAGVTLASMNIPQVIGYTRIAGTPVVTGLYTVLLPLVAFAVFGSSRHLVVAADSATAAIFSSSLSHMAAPAQREVHGAGRHGGAADRRVSVSRADLQAGIPRRFPFAHRAGRISHRCRVSGRHRDAERHVRCQGPLAADTLVQAWEVLQGLPRPNLPTLGLSTLVVGSILVRQSRCPAIASFAVRGRGDDRGERCVRLR